MHQGVAESLNMHQQRRLIVVRSQYVVVVIVVVVSIFVAANALIDASVFMTQWQHLVNVGAHNKEAFALDRSCECSFSLSLFPKDSTRSRSICSMAMNSQRCLILRSAFDGDTIVTSPMSSAAPSSSSSYSSPSSAATTTCGCRGG